MSTGDRTKVLEDTFDVLEVDPDGKKFDKGRSSCSTMMSDGS